jgi:hypothetical protein
MCPLFSLLKEKRKLHALVAVFPKVIALKLPNYSSKPCKANDVISSIGKQGFDLVAQNTANHHPARRNIEKKKQNSQK